MAVNKLNIVKSPEGENHTAVPKKAAVAKSKKIKSFPIVCIGGSAGSFHAMEKFFTHMPPDAGMAFVIIMHLDPNHVGSVAELIQNFTPMPVVQVVDGVKVESNHVYMIPPNKDMGMHNRKLLLLTPAKSTGYRLPIDYFLQSLAEDQWNKAVAIILSGMGSDGETGVRMIKEKLGMAMVQDPDTAQYNSMPKSALTTNMIDYVLSPEEMPIKLIQYLNHPAHTEDINEQAKIETRDAQTIQKILMLLRSHNGHDFSQYKTNTITRRIDRRLAFHQLPDYNHYVTFLRENPSEIDILFNELLIGVTKFFRDQAAFDALQEKLFSLLRNKKADEPVRVWIAGCSTGEEAYSIAILIMEYYDSKSLKVPKIQIFATDLDMDAIELGRTGSYLHNIAAYIAPDRLDKYFVKNDEHFVVRKELREMIVFAQHNLIKDAPFTRLDLLCCRNVMIYLNGDLQKRIIPIFHYALNPNGILFLGPAETLGGFSDAFTPVDPKWKIFERKEGTAIAGKMIDFPFGVSKQPLHYKSDDLAKPLKKASLFDVFNKVLLEDYTPASVLVNNNGDILYINGKTSKFLELNPGEAVMNINQMVKEGLKYALNNAIHQARVQKTTITVNELKVKEERETRLVNLRVSLLADNALQGLTLILFEDKGLVKKNTRKLKDAAVIPIHNQLTEEMEKELLYTKQQLNVTIEQMETSLEELKSTNEELQSTNEELQSTNEESLTTKEEMQSLNEELMTINMQYQTKAEEITQLNNDMKNMLDSTEIGTIFLDINLVILRFTPQVKKVLNVINTDIGRTITDIVFNFDYPELEADIREVVELLAVKETEVKTKKGEWYNLRIMPYRTLDNFINGAVLTFTKITKLKHLEYRFNALQEYAKSLTEELNAPALLLNNDLRVIKANQAYLKLFGVAEQQLEGITLSVLAYEFWKTSKVDKVIKHPLEEASVTFTHEFPDKGSKEITISVKPSVNPEVNETLMVLIVIEKTV
jgi:two-component system CheB/CheR fusion protein